jgi:hypothetical protein
MVSDSDYSLRIGRLEDKFALHEPVLISLHGLVSVADEINKIQEEMQSLRDSKMAMKGKIAGMLQAHETAYKDILELSQERNKLVEDCPIKDVLADIKILKNNHTNLKNDFAIMDTTIDTVKMKGWDLLFRIVPWALLFGVAMWTAIRT